MSDYDYDVYIMSRSGTLYIGVTNNLTRRVFEHKTDSTEGIYLALQAHSPGLLRTVHGRS